MTQNGNSVCLHFELQECAREGVDVDLDDELQARLGITGGGTAIKSTQH